MSESQKEGQVLLTTADIERWEQEGRSLDAEISALVVKKDALSKRLEAARLFLSGVAARPATAPQPQPAKQVARPTKKVPKPKRMTIGQQWQDQIMAIVSGFDRGCTYAELRAALMASALGPRLAESDKSYQRAMSKLGQAGKIERGFGRVFTPQAFAAFNGDLEAGLISPVQSQPMARSPMGEAILKIVYDAPGSRSKDIIAELRKDPEFNATLTPHESGAYNIIARLVRRQQIVKRDDGGCFPGIAFPHDLLGLPAKQLEPAQKVISLFDTRRTADG